VRAAAIGFVAGVGTIGTLASAGVREAVGEFRPGTPGVMTSAEYPLSATTSRRGIAAAVLARLVLSACGFPSGGRGGLVCAVLAVPWGAVICLFAPGFLVFLAIDLLLSSLGFHLVQGPQKTPHFVIA
jgi:hypothetical protein